MVMWIESQETHLIVLIVFGLWFLASAMIFIRAVA
jgi:hypothetical protein